MTFDRPPREVYLRAAYTMLDRCRVELGLELHEAGDDVAELRVGISGIIAAVMAWPPSSSSTTPSTALETAQAIEHCIRVRFPGRAYFIESWFDDGPESWVQIFQPFGVPRNR